MEALEHEQARMEAALKAASRSQAKASCGPFNHADIAWSRSAFALPSLRAQGITSCTHMGMHIRQEGPCAHIWLNLAACHIKSSLHARM